jgi:hypothetical protein
MSTKNHIPNTVDASLDARLAPFCGIREGALEDLDAKMSPHSDRPRLGLINDLKLLFAALAAGGAVVPLGDNSRTTRLLSEYAASLRSH